MKKTSLILFLLIAVICFESQTGLYAQDSTRMAHYNYGFGAAVNDDRFFFPMFITNRIKIEPELELNFNSPRYSTWQYKNIKIGSGFFFSNQYSSAVIYYGIRGGYIYRKEGFSSETYYKDNGLYIAPTIGGEYFLLSRFSLGTELQFEYLYMNSDTSALEKHFTTRRSLWTYAYFIMRFYIFK